MIDEDIYPCMLQCIDCQSSRNYLEDTNYSRFHKICTNCRNFLIDNKVQKCNVCNNSISIYKVFPPQPSTPSSNLPYQIDLQPTESFNYTNDYSDYRNIDIEQSTNTLCNGCYQDLTTTHFKCSHNICYSCLVNNKCINCRICSGCNANFAVVLYDNKNLCQECYENHFHSISNQFECKSCLNIVVGLYFCSNCTTKYCITCYNKHLEECTKPYSQTSEFMSNVPLSSYTSSAKNDIVSSKTQYSNCHNCNDKMTSDKCKICNYDFCNGCLMSHLPCSNRICIRCGKSNNTGIFFECNHYFCQSCGNTVTVNYISCPYCV